MTPDRGRSKRYRLNVGVVVFNAEGRVWLGRRADARGEKTWQFPQGGVDGGEDLLDAAKRELFEETGIRSVSLMARAPGWITYDFPPGFRGAKAMRGFAGQTQAWFAFRFEGDDQEVDLTAHAVAEFDAWRWADLGEAPDLVVPFKREAYRKVVAAFAPLRTLARPPESRRGSILMIHGVSCTGAAFKRLEADFEERGWRVRSPTLRPDLRRAETPPPELAEATLADYVDEAEGWVDEMARQDGQAPVLFGHAMGALIVQKLLERGCGRAGVLLAPAAAAGVRAGLTPAAAFTFANILTASNLEAKSLKIWRIGFDWGVANCVPAGRRSRLYAQSVFDSGKVYAAMKTPDASRDPTIRIDPQRIQAPVLTVGGGRDRATPLSWARATAARFAERGGEFRPYPAHGHWIIDEPGTDRVAADIDAWLWARLT